MATDISYTVQYEMSVNTKFLFQHSLIPDEMLSLKPLQIARKQAESLEWFVHSLFQGWKVSHKKR